MMKKVTNTKMIRRNAKIGQYMSIGALVILGIGLYISFKYPTLFAYSLLALLLGFFLSQVGMYYGNRWGRSPRPDQIIDDSLKGLGRDFTVYHYVTPASHLLVGPAGIWTLLPYFQSGVITYEKKRWRSKGGGFIQGYLRIFGQENIGRPEIESKVEIESANRYLVRLLPEGTRVPEIQALLIFTNPKAVLNVEGAPTPALVVGQVKDFMREKVKTSPLSEELLSLLTSALPQPEKEE
jgi:hypothetical protein